MLFVYCLEYMYIVNYNIDVVCVLQQELSQKQAEQVVRQILSDIIEGIREPDRPRAPIDAYITEEEVFSRKNPGVGTQLSFLNPCCMDNFYCYVQEHYMKI